MYIKLGKLQQQQGQLKEAIFNFQKAIAIDPSQPYWVYLKLGNTLSQQMKFDEAVTAYYKAIQMQPNPSAQMYKDLGNALNQQGKISEAKAIYEQGKIQEATNNLNQFLSFLKRYPCHNRDVIDVDIFDNGCEPTGMQLSLLAEQTTGRVVGTNVAEGFPEHTVQYKTSNAEFYRMDGQALTFPDNSFGVVMSFNVLEHVPNPVKYLKECCRVLRPGGYGYFSWKPIWSSANGHHMSPGYVMSKAEEFEIKPFPNYRIDGKTIPFWSHLLLTPDEMLSLLVNEKKYAPTLAEWMVDFIYKEKFINRYFWQDFLSTFQNESWVLLEIIEDKQYIPRGILSQLRQKYQKYNNANDFQIKGATIIVYKEH